MGAHRNFSREGQGLGKMASAEREPITGVWGRAPVGYRRRGQGAKTPRLKLKAFKKHLHHHLHI